MPRYFFDVIEGDYAFLDSHGAVHQSAGIAIVEALVIAGELAQDRRYHDCLVEVIDESGREIATVPVAPHQKSFLVRTLS